MVSEQLSMFEGQSQNPAPTDKPSTIYLTKTVNASNQKVFDQWLMPVFIGEWMFGPKVQQEQVVSLENKVRRGGEFAFKVIRKSTEIVHTGEYIELDVPNKLVFSWSDNLHRSSKSQVTVLFQEANNKTRLKITIKLDPKLYNEKDSLKKQWSARCSALAAKFK
ncbi:MAG: SRPBCC family protein [Pseudomonadota bacterium]|nr:SRPBCC family protein [Pseudomonadota bacterium]